MLTKACSMCKQQLPVEQFRKRSDLPALWHSRCIVCTRAQYRTAEYRVKNAIRQRKRRQTAEGKAHALESSRKSKAHNYLAYKAKVASDPVLALARRIRALVRITLKGKGYAKTSRTHEILGCTFDELKTHLESRFSEGMSWANFSKWHIDHIIPVSLAKTEADVVRLNHYSNLQPLWAKDNLLKSNKVQYARTF